VKALTTLLCAGIALSACTTMGTGTGSVSPSNEPVTFSWKSTDGGVSGTMSAALKDGQTFSGPYLQVTSTTQSQDFEPMWSGWGLGWGGWGGFGGAGISNYQNTAIGQVVVLAYIEAYTKLVGDLGGLSTDAKADAPQRTVTMTRPGVMRATPNVKGKVVRTLDPGMILYPTGNTDGAWREVTDEVDNKGWVPNGSLAMAR